MVNPIFESRVYRRDIAEARALEELLRVRFPSADNASTIATGAGLDTSQINLNAAPAAFWMAILDLAARLGELDQLLDSVDRNLLPAPKEADAHLAIDRVRQVAGEGGSLSPMRLLLSGDRPFLGRKALREVVPELRNWQSAAAILVVRGDPDSGRTETQLLLDEGRDAEREKFVLLDEMMPLDSAVRAIWRAAGVPGQPPSAGQETLSTESAMATDFWTDVKDALEDNGRRLWVLFDDLDKGPGRIGVRMLAEVLAIRFKDVSFQRRIRLVLLGYPEPQLPSKVPGVLVRNDTTDLVDDGHVKAFVDFCANAKGRALGDAAAAANDLLARAKAKTTGDVPFLEALNGELRAWFRGL